MNDDDKYNFILHQKQVRFSFSNTKIHCCSLFDSISMVKLMLNDKEL